MIDIYARAMNKILNTKIETEYINKETYNSNNIKTMVFFLSSIVKEGISPIILQFPYDGEIIGINTFCNGIGTDDLEFTIEKISESNFIINAEWIDILQNHLKIQASNNINDNDYSFNSNIVSKNDYFRINVLNSNDSLSDMTIQINIRYET